MTAGEYARLVLVEIARLEEEDWRRPRVFPYTPKPYEDFQRDAMIQLYINGIVHEQGTR
jgi:hypothetical protein